MSETMMCWAPDDCAADTQPPAEPTSRTADLARLLALAGQRLTEAAAALVLLDGQLDAHLAVLDPILLASQRRTAAFAITCAFEACFKVVKEADALGLARDLEEFGLALVLEELAQMSARTAEGYREHSLDYRVEALKDRAKQAMAWAKDIS